MPVQWRKPGLHNATLLQTAVTVAVPCGKSAREAGRRPPPALAQAHPAGPAGATVLGAALCAQLNGTVWSRHHRTVGSRFETP